MAELNNKKDIPEILADRKTKVAPNTNTSSQSFDHFNKQLSKSKTSDLTQNQKEKSATMKASLPNFSNKFAAEQNSDLDIFSTSRIKNRLHPKTFQSSSLTHENFFQRKNAETFASQFISKNKIGNLSQSAFRKAAQSVGPRLTKNEYFPGVMGLNNCPTFFKKPSQNYFSNSYRRNHFPQVSNPMGQSHSQSTATNLFQNVNSLTNSLTNPLTNPSGLKLNYSNAPREVFQRKSVGERPFEKNPQHIEQILYRDFNVGLNAASMMADKIVESTFGKKFDPEQADHIEQLMYYGPKKNLKQKINYSNDEKSKVRFELFYSQLLAHSQWRENEWKCLRQQIYVSRCHSSMRMQKINLANAMNKSMNSFSLGGYRPPYMLPNLCGEPPPKFIRNDVIQRNTPNNQRKGNARRICIRCRNSMHPAKLISCSMCKRMIHSFCLTGGIMKERDPKAIWFCSQKCKNKAITQKKNERDKPRKLKENYTASFNPNDPKKIWEYVCDFFSLENALKNLPLLLDKNLLSLRTGGNNVTTKTNLKPLENECIKKLKMPTDPFKKPG